MSKTNMFNIRVAMLASCLAVMLLGNGRVMAQEAPKENRVPTWAWVSMGVGEASFIGATVTTIVAKGKLDELETECASEKVYPAGDYCLSNAFRVKVAGYENFRDASITLWIVGAVGMGLGITGAIWGMSSKPKPTNALVLPWVSPTNAGLTITGRF